MMTPEGMVKRVQRLIKRGYRREVAEDYASFLGDIIEEDAQGRWLIRNEQGHVIDAIKPLEESE